jgi:hypothetical protein
MAMRIPFLLVLLLTSAGSLSAQETAKKRSPIAPSLPYLTNDEEAKLDRIIDRFILFDTGRLPGPEGQAALHDFEKLGYESIPALIRGLNKAAGLEHSCPTLVISKKLSRLLAACDDAELLEFARDTLGSGVGPTSHKRVIEDLRFNCLMRKNDLARRASYGPKSPSSMTTVQLMDSIRKEKGEKQRAALLELETRRGAEAFVGLASVAANADSEQKAFVRGLLESNLGRQSATVVKDRLKDADAEVRAMAARVVAAKQPALAGDLIDLLADEVSDVRQAARQALVKLARGEDHGPSDGADRGEIAQAQAKWRDWWTKQNRR